MEQCKRCALAGECHRVWKNPDAPNVTCVSYTPTRTKADEIRAMDDRELARQISYFTGYPANPEEVEYWYNWLQQPAEE